MTEISKLAKKPPLGWNSFDSFGTVTNEKALYDNLEVFKQRLKPAGYEYLVLDIGWYGEYDMEEGKEFPIARHAKDQNIDRYGRYLPSESSFPNGIKEIIDKVHQAGLKFGIHIMRGIPRKAVEENTPIFGTDKTAEDIADKESICDWCHYNYGIDMSKVGAQEYYNSFIDLLADWGVDFIKADDIVPYPDEIIGLANAVEQNPREIVLSLSPGITVNSSHIEAYKRSNMLRITEDIWDYREDFDIAFKRWHEFENIDKPDWFWIDLDMIPFGKLSVWRNEEEKSWENEDLLQGKGIARMSNLNRAQKRTFITMRALAASPLFMGGHLPETDEYSFQLLTDAEMLACNQNGVIGHQVYSDDQLDIRITEMNKNSKAGWIGIFNRSKNKMNRKIYLTEIDPTMNLKTDFFDIWNNKKMNLSDTNIKIDLDADDVMFLKYISKN